MTVRAKWAAALLVAVTISAPAMAGWKLVPAQKPLVVEKLVVTPASDWNRASARPGKHGVRLTHDGFDLDVFEIFAGIGQGEPLYRERSAKRNPMPKFDRTMLATDLGDFFERSFRVANNLTDMTVEAVAPADLAGHRGIAIRYCYALPGDALVRQGTARLAVVGGKLHVLNFFAPRLHYFAARAQEAESMMAGARL